MTEPYRDLHSPLADAQESRRMQRDLFVSEQIDAFLDVLTDQGVLTPAQKHVARMQVRARLLPATKDYTRALNLVDQALVNRVTAILSSEIAARQIGDDALAARVAALEAHLAGILAAREAGL